MGDRSSIFDMIGPIMIGPSSSHTAGVVKIGLVAYRLLGESVQQVDITFYNSFASTYEGHGSDRAVIAGLLGFETDDERIRNAVALAKHEGVEIRFKTVYNDSTLHPNTIKIQAKGAQKSISIKGVSKGGGIISIVEIDGFSTHFSAQSPTLIITAKDVPGSIAFISSVIRHDEGNIATMTVNRTGKHAIAKLVFEIDHALKPITISYLKELSWVQDLIYLPILSSTAPQEAT